MGGEQQLKAFIAQAFSLQNVADRAILDVDGLLGRVMLDVKRMVEQLPEESLLRDKAWKELRPIVKTLMAPYSQGLKQAIEREEVIASPEMKAYAVREAEYAGAKITGGLGAPLQASVIEQVNRAQIGKARFRELFMPKDGPVTPWVEQMFRVVDRNVRAGIIQGLTTQQIADQVVHETISKGLKGVSLRGQTSVRTIRAQAMAMSRTVTQDVSRQIAEELWAANAEALEGFVYQWSAALDSKTCQSCAPLDQRRWTKLADAPSWPLHVNCRCRLLRVDPDDEFWNEGRKTGQQISKKPYRYKGKPIADLSKAEKLEARNKGHYVTKTKVKGERFYRKAKEFTGNDYSDYLASSNELTQIEFFGGGSYPSPKNPRGSVAYRRMRYFRKQIDEFNKDPQEVLAQMLMGPTNAKKFIAVP